MKLKVFLCLVYFLVENINAQRSSWNIELESDSVLIVKAQAKIQALTFDSILNSFQGKKALLLSEQIHDVWDLLAIKNSIVQQLCRREKINFLTEGSIYEFYYTDCKKIHQERRNIGPADFTDVYFGGTLGDDLMDSLDGQKTLDSISIFGMDYIARNVPQLSLLYNDLLLDVKIHTTSEKIKIDTAFVRQLIHNEMVNHAEITDFKYNENIRQNIEAITVFYDQILIQHKTIENKCKKRMWQCFYQSLKYLLAQKDMDYKKAIAFDLKTMTEQGWTLRDKFLYENIRWFYNEILDTTKVTVVSVASSHSIKSMDLGEKLNKQMNEGYRSLGMLLKADPFFRNKLYCLAVIPTNGYHGIAGNAYFKLPSPPKNSIEHKVETSSTGVMFYDLHKQPATFVMHPFPNDLYLSRDWSEFYDSIIFVSDVLPNFFSKPRHE